MYAPKSSDKQKFCLDLFYNLLEESMEWMASYFLPEDVFSKEQLEEWAKENGWIQNAE